MDHTPTTEAPVDRRRLLRGGALLAGAVGATAVSSLATAGPAAAADGQPVKLGATNTASSPTTITGPAPGLVLRSPGAGLRIESGQDGVTTVGDVAATTVGLEVGVDRNGDGVVEGAFVALDVDLVDLPVLYPYGPERLLDTRQGSRNIAGSSPSAFDRKHRLKGGSYLDVLVHLADDPLFSAFLTVHAVGATGSGHLVVYDGGPVPEASTLDFSKTQPICNSTLCSLMDVPEGFGVRIWTSTTTHVIVDLAGVAFAPESSEAANRAEARRQQRRAKLVAAQRARLARR